MAAFSYLKVNFTSLLYLNQDDYAHNFITLQFLEILISKSLDAHWFICFYNHRGVIRPHEW